MKKKKENRENQGIIQCFYYNFPQIIQSPWNEHFFFIDLVTIAYLLNFVLFLILLLAGEAEKVKSLIRLRAELSPLFTGKRNASKYAWA